MSYKLNIPEEEARFESQFFKANLLEKDYANAILIHILILFKN